MSLPSKKSSSAESLATISNVLLAAFIVCTLYFGRELIVPFALAALLTFMLAPLVTRLQRGIGRVAAVIFVVMMIVVATGAAGWILTRQAVDLANKLPDYKENIRTKLQAFKMPSDSSFSKVSQTVEELKKDLPGGNDEDSGSDSPLTKKLESTPLPVEVVNHGENHLQLLQGLVAPVLGPLGTASLVLLLLMFMLLQREDLANRLIRLIGQGHISATSRAMDDAGSRVSKYLLMQLVVNVTYGIPVAIGLYFIGVPNAILWGSLATVLRFIPYVGPWIAAAFPILLSLAISPHWTTPLLTIGLFVVLELLSNNVMEPWLYGSSTGVSPIALIVAALFWTWLWGPVGLVLATPLTVCLVVMGRHIPKLNFLSIVLSDEEPLTPAEDLYHRLHRSGEHDEMEFVDQYLKTNPIAALFDSIMIPVITAAETDHRLGHLETEQLTFIERGVSDVLNELEVRLDVEPAIPTIDYRVCCIPAKGYRDEMAGDMLEQLLRRSGVAMETASAAMTSGERVEWVGTQTPDLACISAVLPTTAINARYLCSKLRKRYPDLKIMVGLWECAAVSQEELEALRQAGANEIVTTLDEAVERIDSRLPDASEMIAES
jgi:predicted PurR-regulated permease PerM